jgi:hypothetical protein
MKMVVYHSSAFDEHLGCFGEFDARSEICKKYCVLSLRCSVEREQNKNMEYLEDLISYDGSNIRFQ